MSTQPTLDSFMKAVEKATTGPIISPSLPPAAKRTNADMTFSPEAAASSAPSPSLSETLLKAVDIPIPEGTDPFLGGMLKAMVTAQGHMAKTTENALQAASACSQKIEKMEKRISKNEEHRVETDLLLKTMFGRIVRLEIDLKREKEAKADMQARSMGNNLIINTEKKLTNYKQQANENTEYVIRRFLTETLNMKPETVKSIHITQCHRMGAATEKMNTPLIAKIPSHKQRMAILGHTKVLEKTKSSVTIQTPAVYNERKQHSWKAFKAAKAAKKPAAYRQGHLLYVENKPVQRYLPVPLPYCGSDILGIERDELVFGTSDCLEKNGHSIQARIVRATDTQIIRDAIDESLREGFSSADFVSYAFRISDDDIQGGHLEDFESGGNPYAGIHLLQYLQKENISDALVILAQHSDKDSAPMKSKERNAMITEAVNAAVEALTGGATEESESESGG